MRPTREQLLDGYAALKKPGVGASKAMAADSLALTEPTAGLARWPLEDPTAGLLALPSSLDRYDGPVTSLRICGIRPAS